MEGNLLYIGVQDGLTTQSKGEVAQYRNGEQLYLVLLLMHFFCGYRIQGLKHSING